MGWSPRTIDGRVADGRWLRILPGIYAESVVTIGWRQRLKAVDLWGKGSVAISSRSAAALWGMGPATDLVEGSTTRRGLRPPKGVLIHRCTSLDPCDLDTIFGILITNPTRTILDLGAVCEEEEVMHAVDSALRQGLTSLPRLRWRLQVLGKQGRRGAGALRRILDEYQGAVPDSHLERKFLLLFRKGGMPPPVKQLAVREGGKVLARLDLAYPELKLAIEVDGYRHHSGKPAWKRDRERQNLLTSRGWRVIHFTSDDLKRPDTVLKELRRFFEI